MLGTGEATTCDNGAENFDCQDCQDQSDELLVLESIFSGCPGQLKYTLTPSGQHTKVNGEISVHLPKFDKTITIKCSIKEVKKELHVNYLPPIRLLFDLPSDYPSSSAPVFTIESIWLTSFQKTGIESTLKESWTSNRGMPILYLWTDLIQDEAKSILDAVDCIDLDCVHVESNIPDKQNNVSKECLNEVRYREIEAFAEGAEEEDFRRGFFECEVCFESRSGDDCVKFYPCGHIFCKQCVTAFYRHQLKELSIKRLECLDQKCESLASEKQLKTVLTDDEIEWYEKILLFNGLDTMQDVVICPRMSCGAHVLLDEDQAKGSSLTPNLAHCAECNYTFCIICKKTYHGLEDCVVNATLREELLAKYDTATAAEKRRLEEHMNFLKSDEWIETNCKQCPKCRSKIEKTEGCNKMSCSKCKNSFCWLCGTLLDKRRPYDHFNIQGASRCYNRLFEGMEHSDDEEEDSEEDDNEVVFG